MIITTKSASHKIQQTQSEEQEFYFSKTMKTRITPSSAPSFTWNLLTKSRLHVISRTANQAIQYCNDWEAEMRALSCFAAAILATFAIAASATGPNPAINGPKGPNSRAAAPSEAVSPAFLGLPVPTPGLLFTPLKACKLFDSRDTTRVSTSPRTYLVSGSGDFAGQGSSSPSGCGIPASAEAIALTMTTLSSVGSGTVRVSPQGSNVSIAAVSFNPSHVQTGAVLIGLAANSIAVKTSAGSTHVLGEVSGYFAPQLFAHINSNGTIYTSTPRVLSSSRLSTGVYKVIFDRDLSYCNVYSSPWGGPYYTSAFNTADAAYIFTWPLNANAAIVSTDIAHTVLVSC